MTDRPLTAPHDRRLPSSPASTAIEQDAPNIDSLMQVITDLQHSERQAIDDRDLADREIRRLRREADALRQQLNEVREADPRSKLIREVLDYWIKALGKTKRTKCPANGTRWQKVRARLNDGFTVDQLKRAIDGCAHVPFVGPHGRQNTDERGGKRHDDIELICRDETTVERFIGYADQAEEQQEPESVERQFVRHVYGDECKLQYRPASREPRSRPSAPGAPIDKVLDGLRAAGCTVVTYQAHADQWSAQCPAHEDRDPSLSIHRKPDGQILLNCWAGCPTEDVIGALGLEWRDLWEDTQYDTNRLDGPRPDGMPAHLLQAMRQVLNREQQRNAA